MFESWVRPVEQIVLSSVQKGHRIIGFTAPEGSSGVSTLATATAEVCAHSGFRTLLVDFTFRAAENAIRSGWLPGATPPNQSICHGARGFDYIDVQPNSFNQFAFNNVAALRKDLDELIEYEKIVIDLPPANEVSSKGINPAAAAAGCDAVFLVCALGRLTQAPLRYALELASS